MYIHHGIYLDEYFNLRLHDLSLAAGRLIARHDLLDVSVRFRNIDVETSVSPCYITQPVLHT